MLDLQGIEDENERAKAMKRRIEEDRKKALRVKEAEERADQKEREKLQKSLEKSTKKGKKKWTPPPEPEGKSPVAPSPTYESGSHAPTFSRGTKRDSSYEQLSQIPILTTGEELEIQTWRAYSQLLNGGRSWRWHGGIHPFLQRVEKIHA